MKQILTTLALCAAFIMQPVQANQENDCRFVLNTAQIIYSNFFPDNPATQFIDSWCFRSYKTKEFGIIYAGMNLDGKGFKKDGIYTLNGPFGDKPLYIGQANKVIDLLKSQLKDEACDSSNNSLAGIDHKQEGNTLFISTKKCIKPPKSSSFCDLFPDIDEIGKPRETDIHLLMDSNVSSFEFTGVKIPTFPGFPDPLDAIVDGIANQTTCVVHAPRKSKSLTVKTDICFDMSDELANIPGINLPVELRFKSTSKSEEVDDCFNTNAASIHNAVTGQNWINKNGRFEEIN